MSRHEKELRAEKRCIANALTQLIQTVSSHGADDIAREIKKTLLCLTSAVRHPHAAQGGNQLHSLGELAYNDPAPEQPEPQQSEALARALDRGKQWKKRTLDAVISSPEMLRPNEATEKSHLSRSRLDALQREGKILALRRDSIRLYPAWQFLEEGYNSRLGAILALFAKRDPIWIYYQLTSGQALLGGKRPKDLIRKLAFERLHRWALQMLGDEQGAL